MVTGNDILNYQGNPNLSGFGGDGNPMLGSDKDHYGELAGIFRDINNKNFLWNTQKYDQAIKDRDDSTKLLSQQNTNLPMEPEDQKVLEERFGKIKDIWLKNNGNPMNKGKSRLEAQTAVAEFQRDRTLAQARNLEAGKQRDAISKEQDPETKKKMGAHLNEQLGKGLGHVPEPYAKELDYDLGQVLYNPGMEAIGSPEVIRDPKTGIASLKTVQGTDPKKIIDYYNLPKIMEGNNKTLPNQIDIFYNYLKNDPRLDEPMLIDINTKLDALNKRTGAAPGSRYYVEPFAKKVGDQWQLDENPIEAAKKLALYSYGDQRKENIAAPKDPQKALLQVAQEKTQVSMQERNRAAAAKDRMIGPALAEKYRQEGELAKSKGETEKYKLANLKLDAIEPAKSVYTAMHNVSNQSGYKPASEIMLPQAMVDQLVNTNPAAYDTFVKNKDNYEFKEISANDPVIWKMVASQATDKAGKPLNLAQKPQKIFIVKPKNGSVEDMQVIGVGKNGINIVDYKEGAVNLIRADNGFKSDDKVLKRENATRAAIGDMVGGAKDIEDAADDNAEADSGEERAVGTYEIDGKNYYYDGEKLNLVQ